MNSNLVLRKFNTTRLHNDEKVLLLLKYYGPSLSFDTISFVTGISKCKLSQIGNSLSKKYKLIRIYHHQTSYWSIKSDKND